MYLQTLSLICCVALTHAGIIPLPPGARVEGVAHAAGTNFFAADFISGNILLADARSGLVTTAIRPGANRTSAGMYASKNMLFVAGLGPVPQLSLIFGTGPGQPASSLNVYDIPTGRTLASCVVDGGIVNDVVADREYAYFSDSALGVLYRLSVDDVSKCDIVTIDLPSKFFGGTCGDLPGSGTTANGLVKYKGGLIVANTELNTLFFVDLQNGNKVEELLLLPTGSAAGVDGLYIVRKKGESLLYIAQNIENAVSVWKLGISGRSVSARRVRVIKREAFSFPTTVALAEKDGWLVVPNLRLYEVPFVDESGQPSQTVFTLSAVRF